MILVSGTPMNVLLPPCLQHSRIGADEQSRLLPESQHNAGTETKIVLSVIGSVGELGQEVIGLEGTNSQPGLHVDVSPPPASMAKPLAAPVEPDVTGK